METTSETLNSSLKKLCEQYDQEMANIEVDLDIHEKLIKLMKENCAINQQQSSSMEKNREQMAKELQLLDEKTNELVQSLGTFSTNSQGEKIEELKRMQQRIMSGISDAQERLLAAQNAAQNDLDKLHSTGKEAQIFLESSLVSSDFCNVSLKLQNCQKTFSSKVQESVGYLSSVKSIADEANHLQNLEKVLEEMRMNAANLEGQIGEIDAQCSVCHKKTVMLNMEKEEEKQRRNAISEKYKQLKSHVSELTYNLNNRKNDKKFLSESLNCKKQELNDNEERLKKKSSEIAVVQEEVDAIKKELAKIEETMKFEREMHEQKVQDIKSRGEANILATKSVLMGLREEKSAKVMQIEQVRDHLSKKSQLDTHKKINEEMEQNLELLKQEKAQLQLLLKEKEDHRNAQISEIKAMKNASQENRLKASERREFLVEEVKRVSGQILGLKRKILTGERQVQQNPMRQPKITPVGKSVGSIIHHAFQKEKCRQNRTEEQGSLTRQLTGQGKVGQELRGVAFNEMKSTFVVAEVKEPLLRVKNSGDGGEAQTPITQQENPSHPYRCSANESNKVSDTLLTASGSAKLTRQPRKKSEKRKVLTTQDESSFCNDTARDKKRRGRPKGKRVGKGTRAGNDNSKFEKKKDAYDLDSDFD
ncbi:unnamed protein product [Litomosoides sigmodontis]|uniref:Uncharacterized protein n=1 Tax=Litomosoides sigmodontis TaxID=42156 RepID=A0A3P6TFL2_LITSI|nr:unnamed protein product [Litomosoides sigmodontis]